MSYKTRLVTAPCPYCRRPFKATSRSRAENPFCAACLEERLAATNAGLPPARIDLDGRYVVITRSARESGRAKRRTELMFSAAVGGELARLRNQKQIRQVDLAKQLGMNQGRLSKLERGRVPLRVEMLAQWATALGTKSSDVLAAVNVLPSSDSL